MRKIICIIVLILGFLSSKAQNPKYIVRNYDNQYLNGVWSVVQDTLGYLYFGTREGFTVYDGNNWTLIETGSDPTRCLFKDSKGRIWYGSVNDFGKIYKSKIKGIYNESFRELLPEDHRSFGDVWSINNLGGNIFFQSRNKIFVYNEIDGVKCYNIENTYHRAIISDSLYIVNSQGKGLFGYINQEFIPLKGGGFFKDKTISGSLILGPGTTLIGTRLSGLYKYNIKTGRAVPAFKGNEETINFLKRNKLYNMISLPDGNIAFATLLDGTLITNSTGKKLKHLNGQTGVNENKHYSVYVSKDNNLWMGTPLGCSAMNICSPLSLWDKSHGIEGIVSTLMNYGEGILVGSLGGLYYLPDPTNSAAKISKLLNTEIWEILRVDENLNDNIILIASSDGLYRLGLNTIKHIHQNELILRILQLNINGKYLLGFTPDNILVFSLNDAKITYLGKISGLFNEFRSVAQSIDKDIWIGTRANQIIRLDQSEILSWINNRDISINAKTLETSRITDPIYYKNQVYFTNVEGLFSYDEKQDTLFRCTLFGEDMVNLYQPIIGLFEDDIGNIWLGGNKILLNRQDGSYSLYKLPYENIQDDNDAFVFLHAGNDKTWIGGNKGLFLYDRSNLNKNHQEVKVIISSVVTADTIHYIYNNTCFPDDFEKIIKKKKDFSIYYSLPIYSDDKKIEYSYYLDGYSEEWSNWSKQGFSTFTNLDPDRYSFMVKARIGHGEETEISCFGIEIERLWYQSIVAFSVYVLLFAFVIILVFKLYVKVRIMRELKIERMIQTRLQQKYFLHYRESKEQRTESETKSEVEYLHSKKTLIKSKQEKFLNQVLDIIDSNIDDSDFNVEKLCKTMRINQTMLYRNIKSYTGMSISSFMRKVRLKRALQLMAESDLTISEIAYKVGFNDPGYFTKCFTNEYGQPPSSFSNFDQQS